MTGRKAPSAHLRFIMPALALVALGGAMGAGHAEPAAVELDAPIAASASAFTPSAEAQFEEAFVHLEDAAAEPVLPSHAVDIATIDPPTEPAATALGEGVASYYGRRFAGRPTANGETFDPQQLTAAHKTLPFGSMVRVTNTRNGRQVVVRINDRGPFVRGRTIDLSRAAAEEIGIVSAGHGTVELELLEG
ncbi:septal ring lytic transglycosylase RlpA family protein [Alteraurantiacibacter aquimixticola]|uniref:Endolytic peptidoglycan transglycosylase RlpA n=1 Tax=Alteraurantiacibacter aquimixticola TaxID=2489173 RepID=A0A4V4U8L5_9SPHN|nr:septal ring lytic transglycosylase RlpA family protein [Alteraurantiacibacter aquimixticola]TIX50383.1 septal ring lytic transglycosylase RlpA family protein [Alteraurantiacibacter aquimixticola]